MTAFIAERLLWADVSCRSAAEDCRPIRTFRNFVGGYFDAFQHDRLGQLGKVTRMQIAIRKAGADFNSAKSGTRESAHVILQCLTAGYALCPQPCISSEDVRQRLRRGRVRRSKQAP